MQIFDDLTKVFQQDYFVFADSALSVSEFTPSAKTKQIKLVYDDEMLLVKASFLEASRKPFVDKHCAPIIPMDSICDGALVINQPENYIFIFELKSTFSNTKFNEAKRQISVSCLKYMLIFDAFENFKTENYKVVGVIISQPIDTERKLKYLRATKTMQTGSSSYEKIFNLCKNKYCYIKKDEEICSTLPFKRKFFYGQIPVLYYCVDGPELTLNVKDLLNKADSLFHLALSV